MKLLILGGTVFLGRHLVESALRSGHDVTLFNRGQHNADIFPNVEKIHGDRDGGLASLAGRHWDAVIDTCGYVPRLVKASAEALAGSVDDYTFVSTISVYATFAQPSLDEDCALGTLTDPTVEEITGETYGPLKALCEAAAKTAMPGRVLIIRPGLIVGPFDPTNRFTYWPSRIARGGDVLAPGRPERLIQIIDARDLADWTLRLAERRETGVFNATGPDYELTMGRLLQTCQDVSAGRSRIVWANDHFLKEAGVGEWMEMPLWFGEGGQMDGLMQANCGKAFRSGLTFRPLVDTVRDTLAWDASQPADMERPAGMTQEKEQHVLGDWVKASAAAG